MITDPANSKMETKGFPSPAVDTEDCARSATVVPCTNPATPPPAIIASAHFRNGDILVTVDAVAMVPAMIVAVGDVDDKRDKLSTQDLIGFTT